MDVYEAARQFDHSYEGFRIDVFPPNTFRRVRVTFSFYTGDCSPAVLRTATRELYGAIQHQIRPFGTCKLVDKVEDHDFSLVIYFEERSITDVGATSLLSKLTHMAMDIAERYGML